MDLVNLDEARLKPKWCVEIKWSNRYIEKPSELKSLLDFCSRNGLQSAIVTTIDKEAIVNYQDIQLCYYPASVYAYTVGANTLIQKQA